MDDKRYGIIAEYKNEGPLVLESKPLDSESAYNRMQSLLNDPKVIRVAVFQMTYHRYGNETLLPMPSEAA